MFASCPKFRRINFCAILLWFLCCIACFQAENPRVNPDALDVEYPISLEKIREVENIFQEEVYPIYMRHLYRYKYFQEYEKYPFDTQASGFSLNNAWWLAEFSALATTEPEFVKSNMERLGFEVRFFYGERTDAECFVAWNSESILVAFRGTEIFGLKDWLTDVKCKLVFWPYGGRVHVGFRNSFFELWTQQGLKDFIESKMAEMPNHSKTLWLTGHSLGAALATLAADAFVGTAQVYTYGSPRVGDRLFQADFAQKTYRFVNHLDIVTNLPPHITSILPYYHVGNLGYLDKNGQIDAPISTSSVQITGWSGFWDRIVKSNVVRLFLDHIPTFYAENLKKNLPE